MISIRKSSRVPESRNRHFKTAEPWVSYRYCQPRKLATSLIKILWGIAFFITTPLSNTRARQLQLLQAKKYWSTTTNSSAKTEQVERALQSLYRYAISLWWHQYWFGGVSYSLFGFFVILHFVPISSHTVVMVPVSVTMVTSTFAQPKLLHHAQIQDKYLPLSDLCRQHLDYSLWAYWSACTTADDHDC